MELCSHTGLSLPWKDSLDDRRKSSIMSLNGVADNEQQVFIASLSIVLAEGISNVCSISKYFRCARLYGWS